MKTLATDNDRNRGEALNAGVDYLRRAVAELTAAHNLECDHDVQSILMDSIIVTSRTLTELQLLQ